MYSNTADCSSSLDGHGRRFTSSFLSVAKNVSATVVRVAAGAHRDRDPRVVYLAHASVDWMWELRLNRSSQQRVVLGL
jgi:hypothetical protein